jgi:hypothetical protein
MFSNFGMNNALLISKKDIQIQKIVQQLLCKYFTVVKGLS